MTITTITISEFSGLKNRFWMFQQMGLAKEELEMTPGLSFYKMLGTGKGQGFSAWPDFGTYVILQVWEDENAFDSFVTSSTFNQDRKSRCNSETTHVLRCIGAKGTWDGIAPFEVFEPIGGKQIAAITRARIKVSKLWSFWSFVPKSQVGLFQNEGLMYSKGIGEVPWLNMATFSIWKGLDAMKDYSRKTPGHRKAIKKTQEVGWYSEELFARFEVIKTI